MADVGPRRPTQSHQQLGVDRVAIQIVDYHLPDVSHRGDITEDDPTKVATEIKSIHPDGQCMVIFIAAPPCQDFLRIGDRAGHQGERGYLFNFTAEFIAELRGLAAPRRFGVLVENVEMARADAAAASKALGCQPLLTDAPTTAGSAELGCGGPPSTGRRSTGTHPPARSGHGPCAGDRTGCDWITRGGDRLRPRRP